MLVVGIIKLKLTPREKSLQLKSIIVRQRKIYNFKNEQ